jgi:DNA-binding NarL/FixJ family response regulator
MTIRVLLADDQTLVREAFAMLVESAGDMEVVGQACDWPAASAPTSW